MPPQQDRVNPHSDDVDADMGNPDDYKPVHEQLQRWRRMDDVEGLRRRVYRALRIAETIAYNAGSTKSERLKACTTITQAGRLYLKILEASDLEERVEELEKLAGLYDETELETLTDNSYA